MTVSFPWLSTLKKILSDTPVTAQPNMAHDLTSMSETASVPDKEAIHHIKQQEERPKSTQDHGIDPHSAMRQTSRLMILLTVFIGLGGFMLNFDIGYTGGVLVMPPFNKSFGHCQVDLDTKATVCALSATQQSVGSSIYLIFLAVGAGLSGLTSNFVGPRGALQVGCVLISIGAAAMVGSAGNFTAYVAAKCIGAVGLGHLQVMGTTYGVECAPPAKRGFLVALFSVGSTTGNLVATLVCMATQHYPTNWSWRTPIICQIPIAMIFGIGLFVFPQSPRWLLTKDKLEESRKAFGRFTPTILLPRRSACRSVMCN